MIEKLQNNDIEVSKKIRSVFQLSYKIEAELLNATDFPPLKRPLINYINSNTEFFGFLNTNSFTNIHSLVVHPSFFRQGIAKKLIGFVFKTFDSNLFVVETGLENGPATELYKKFDFKEVKQWNTDHGIRKIKFERRINN